MKIIAATISFVLEDRELEEFKKRLGLPGNPHPSAIIGVNLGIDSNIRQCVVNNVVWTDPLEGSL